jgi:hypothetical protein
MARGLSRLSDVSQLTLIGRYMVKELALWGGVMAATGFLMSQLSIRWRVFVAFSMVYTFFIVLIYLITPNDLAWHLQSSAGRAFGVVSLCLFCYLLTEADGFVRRAA